MLACRGSESKIAAEVLMNHVGWYDGDDRRPAGEERADDGRGAEDAGEQAECVQRVHDLCQVTRESNGRSMLASTVPMIEKRFDVPSGPVPRRPPRPTCPRPSAPNRT